MGKNNVKNHTSLDERITFRCNSNLKNKISQNSKKKNISSSKFISTCIERYLNENEFECRELAECICSLQTLINQAIPDNILRAEVQERIDTLWHALT